MTEDELEAIATRAERAQVGPWIAEPSARAGEGWPVLFTLGRDDRGRTWCVQTDGVPASEASGAEPENDATFVAHARQDVPALVAEVRRLRDELADVRQLRLFHGGEA